MGIRNGIRSRSVLGLPLLRAGGTLGELPLEAVQVFQEIVAPLCRGSGPGAFQTAGDRVHVAARAKLVVPAETLVLDIASFWFGTYILCRSRGAVRLAE